MDEQRRNLLLGASALLANATLQSACAGSRPRSPAASPPPTPPPTQGNGKPGDFDFLQGSWRIHNRKLNDATKQWDEFAGESTCWSILNGVASIEELRIPARNFAGMGLRLLDVTTGVWTDYWANAKNASLAGGGTPGGFTNGAGIWLSEETVDGKTLIFRGMWDKITATTCRWSQASSSDGGKSWQDNWVMQWTRTA